MQLEQSVKFTITNTRDYDKDEDEDPILTVKVKNAQPKGKIILTKTDKATNEALADVEYELTAKENIYSAVDGTFTLCKKELLLLKEKQMPMENLSLIRYSWANMN